MVCVVREVREGMLAKGLSTVLNDLDADGALPVESAPAPKRL